MIQQPKPHDTLSPAQEADAALELEAMLVESLQLCAGLPTVAANDLAVKLVKVLRLRHGGLDVYIPAPSKAERDAAIRAELRTGNAADVAQRHGVSIRWVYYLAKRRA